MTSDSMLPQALSRNDPRRTQTLKRLNILEPLSRRLALEEAGGAFLSRLLPGRSARPDRAMVSLSVPNPCCVPDVQSGIRRKAKTNWGYTLFREGRG